MNLRHLVVAVLLLQPQTIDRILAVVGGRPILLSDVTAALKLGFVDAGEAADPVRAGLDQLIDRQLALAEVERYLPAEPPPAQVDADLAAVRARFPDEAAFERALRESGLTVDEVRQHLRDDRRIAAYLDGRFGSTLRPTEEQVLAYYRAHDAEFRHDGVLQPFAAVRDEARTRFVAEQRTAIEREWLAGLRRRADISDLYSAGR